MEDDKLKEKLVSPSESWVRKMAELEDGCCISVGGLYSEILKREEEMEYKLYSEKYKIEALEDIIEKKDSIISALKADINRLVTERDGLLAVAEYALEAESPLDIYEAAKEALESLGFLEEEKAAEGALVQVRGWHDYLELNGEPLKEGEFVKIYWPDNTISLLYIKLQDIKTATGRPGEYHLNTKAYVEVTLKGMITKVYLKEGIVVERQVEDD